VSPEGKSTWRDEELMRLFLKASVQRVEGRQKTSERKGLSNISNGHFKAGKRQSLKNKGRRCETGKKKKSEESERRQKGEIRESPRGRSTVGMV